jgi:long-chain acyl-CoA synthetase
MVVLMPQPQVDAILECVQRYRVRWFLGVPALYRMILENDRLDQYDLSSLKYCFCGGDVLPGKVMNRFREKYDLPIYQVYGSTEAGHVTYSRIGTEPSSGSIGYPLESRECLVVDPVTLECVEDGENGELFVTSPYSLKEYYEKPEETDKTYIRVNDKLYCRMGDFVSCKPDGELVYMERSADVIKHKGYRVSASEIEAVLQDHPTVINACVIGIPDERAGERIKAIVVLKEDARGVGGVELIRWCSERLASYKVPGYVEFRDMLPKSKVGKLLRREVRDGEKRKIMKKTDA